MRIQFNQDIYQPAIPKPGGSFLGVNYAPLFAGQDRFETNLPKFSGRPIDEAEVLTDAGTVQDPPVTEAQLLKEKRKAAKKAVIKYINKRSEVLPATKDDAAFYQDFAPLRPQQVNEIVNVAKRPYLKHAIILSENEYLLNSIVGTAVAQMPPGTKVIQLSRLIQLFAHAQGFTKKSGDEEGHPGPFGALKDSREIEKTQERFMRFFFPALLKEHGLEVTDNIVLLLEGVEPGGTNGDVIMNFIYSLEDVFPNVHVILPLVKPNTRESIDGNSIELSDDLKDIVQALQESSGQRQDNVMEINIPEITPNEWPRILLNANNPFGSEAKKILGAHRLAISLPMMTKFVHVIASEYGSLPSATDVLSELDLFGSFIEHQGQRIRRVRTLDIQNYEKEVLAKRIRQNDPGIMNMLRNLESPTPWQKIRHSPLTFDDLVGNEKAKDALKGLLQEDIDALFKLGNKYDKQKIIGVLLHGEPGVGKSTIAEALAGEYDATLIKAAASNLISKYQGSGPGNIQIMMHLVKTAKTDRVVIFLDEIDALPNRDRPNLGSGDDTRTLTSLLEAIDGVASALDKTVVFIGATNRPKDLDSALRNRLSHVIKVYKPTPSQLTQVWKLHLENYAVNLDDNINWNVVASTSNQLSGRAIANMAAMLKRELISRIPESERKAILQSPRRMKEFNVPVSEADLLRIIQNYKQEHDLHGDAQTGLYL